MKNNRKVIARVGQLALIIGLMTILGCMPTPQEAKKAKEMAEAKTEKAVEKPFKISLAQWSLHRTIQGGELDNLDFAKTAKDVYGCDGVEYVNQFFKDKAEDFEYLGEMKKRAAENGVESLLIMVDGEGGLAETDDEVRNTAVENHFKWVKAAKFLGCHSIRVNSFSSDKDPVAAKEAAIKGLSKLATFAQESGINIIVENHGGFSSNGQWLADVMAQVNMPNCGTLPDFGNFCIAREGGVQWGAPCVLEYDRYDGVKELMPYAKGVSAKSHDFDEQGDEINTDYVKMMKVVKESGYKGYIGIEYEGEELSEHDGILATKKLLEKHI